MTADIEQAAETAATYSRTEMPFLTRVRLRARRRVLWMRFLWSGDQSPTEQGLGISHAEVDRILADQARMAEDELLFYESDSTALQLTKDIHEADEQAANDAAWKWLRERFSLSDYEVDLLSLTVAAEADPLLRRVYGYLHDDAGAVHATPWLAAGVFQWPSEVNFGSQSALVRWRIARPAEGAGHAWAKTTPWLADPYIVLWVLSGELVDPALGSAARVIPARESTRKTCLYPPQLASMREFTGAVQRQVRAVEITLLGPKGAGKETLAGQFAATLESSLISADASLLLGPDVPLPLAAERAIQAARMAKLIGGVLHWREANEANPKVWQSVAGYSELTVLSSTVPLAQGIRAAAARTTVTLPSLTRSSRIALWKHATDEPVPVAIDGWILTPAEIVQAAQSASLGPEAVAEACQRNLRAGLGELFTPLPCPYTWDDIVLLPALRDHLGELERQVRLRWLVYEEWGFERLVPLGRGITSMFCGPSGTGKTMAAQVLARSLGMQLYRVDLAGVMNKYIGETEKRLKQIFDACERASVLLFFDEADALFGQRTQVKDAHDRFANIEIDYLLQRMEQFDGVAILATNRKGDLDKAFLRRIRFIVDFLQPGQAERLALWRRVLPARSPGGEELLDRIDWEFLADKLNMTGADITSAALGAAFLARAEGTRIKMSHVLHAARREMTKHGAMLRAGDWGS